MGYKKTALTLFFSLGSEPNGVYLHRNQYTMHTVKTYPTFISHNQYGYALASAISMSQNEVTFDINKLPPSLKSKLYGQITWINLTAAELHQINDARHAVRRVGDSMMSNLLRTREISENSLACHTN